MTDPTLPTDDELEERIRRSLSHYRLERPLPTLSDGGRSRWRAAPLLLAAAAGALLTIAVLASLDALRFNPSVGNPSPQPSIPPSATATGATVAPGFTPLPLAEVTQRCLSQSGDIPTDWLRPGETDADVRARLASLPLLLEDHRATGSIYMFGDDRLTVTCDFIPHPGADMDFLGLKLVHRPPETGVEVGGALAGGGAVDAGGQTNPDELPEMLLQGFAATDVARIEVLLEDGSVEPALLANGAWVAWWQRNVASVSVRAYAADGTLIVDVPYVFAAPAPTGPDGIDLPAETESPAPQP